MENDEPNDLNSQARALVESLVKRPALLERFRAILDLCESDEGEIRTADEIEKLLVLEVRRLGLTTMESWVAGAEERIGEQFKGEQPQAHVGKKTLS